MANVFPSSNLQTSSQPWGREVQRRVQNLESQFSLQSTNSATIDAQLQAAYRRLDTTVLGLIQADIEINAAVALAQSAADDAQEAADLAADAAADADTAATTANNAITGLTSLGSAGSIYDVYADNISGGTITGVTIQSSVSNPKALLDTNGLRFYNTLGRLVLDIDPDTGDAGIRITGYLNGSFIEFDGTSNNIYGGNGTIYLSVNGFGLYTNSKLTVQGEIRAVGGITTEDFLQSENYAGGGVTGASINNNGTIIRTSSSARYKQDIEDLVINYNDVLLLQPKRFKFKDEAAASSNARYYAGFIAEEVDKTSLKDFVAYQTNEDGSRIPDGVYYGELTTALLEAIKHQDSLIKSLTTRIETLENGA